MPMPATKLIFFCESGGTSPAIDWLRQLREENARAYAKCRARLARLAEMGHELRRPEADYMRDGIHELRSRMGTVNYRVLSRHHPGHTLLSEKFHDQTDEENE